MTMLLTVGKESIFNLFALKQTHAEAAEPCRYSEA